MILLAEEAQVGRVVYFSDGRRNTASLGWEDTLQTETLLCDRRDSISYTAVRAGSTQYLTPGLSQKGLCPPQPAPYLCHELLNAGMRLECLQQLLGHQLEVTRRYARLTDKTLREQEYFRAMAIIERGQVDGLLSSDRVNFRRSTKRRLFSTHS